MSTNGGPGGGVNNAGRWTGDANNADHASLVTNSGTWITTSAGFTNVGTLTTTGLLDVTKGGLTNTGTVNANGGAINGAIANNAGAFNVNGVATTNGTFTNAAGATLVVFPAGAAYTVSGLVTNSGTVTVASTGKLAANSGIANTGGTITNNGAISGNLNSNTGTVTLANGSTWTGNLTNNTGGMISLGTVSVAATNQLVTGNMSNAGVVNVFGTPTINGAFSNQTGGVVDLTGSADGGTPTTATKLTATGSFSGQAGSAVKVVFDASTLAGKGDLLTANGTSGTTTVNFANVTPTTAVVLGNSINVIKDTTGAGTLNPTGTTEHFGLVDMSVQSDGHVGPIWSGLSTSGQLRRRQRASWRRCRRSIPVSTSPLPHSSYRRRARTPTNGRGACGRGRPPVRQPPNRQPLRALAAPPPT